MHPNPAAPLFRTVVSPFSHPFSDRLLDQFLRMRLFDVISHNCVVVEVIGESDPC
jgi:hypothetical protein